MKGRYPRCKTANPSQQSLDHEEEKEEDDITSSSCPLCGRVFDVPLLLPCAHTLCGRCLTEKARLDKRRSALRTASQGSHTICAVLCPRCCHGIELPCSDWSSATACLPLDPTVVFDPGSGTQEEDEKEEEVRKKTAQKPGGDVDLSEEEMERSVSGLLFALDASSITPPLQLTNSALTVTFKDSGTQAGGRDLCASLPHVCADVEIHRGQYYWEVDVCNSTLYRIGVSSLAGGDAWWFERRGSGFHAVFDGRRELLPSIPPQLKTVGVFLNVGGASLTFHNPLTEELLAAIPSIFTPPLCPAFQLGQGRLKLRPGLPPPNHVFLSRNSAYRGPEGAGRGRWRRDVAFGSVRVVIQKFEEMSVSDSDSGLMSSCSSDSTLASIPDPSPETSASRPAQER
ncbi:probable E3 ubiquitin-protein ligase MID2 [Ictalurus furcatus]|uniref:probable E3 ubiquitin-protein ligase MID2 n=1 Tax=Ictalurus furcatus TaxID=66913 RepID=UPI002350D1E6|nr:probable E3 ubiquitin-protein ligase MID2 [Ictalurus furcatus]XP_053502497.1 probable E3 ubiquitin-protein ligase MID2 [Ictalurus furcatus]